MAKGYTGQSGSDRAFDKIDKFMSRNNKYEDDGVKTLKEQLDDYNKRTFETIYPTFAIWEVKVMAILRKKHSVCDFAYEDNFGDNWQNLFIEKYNEKILPTRAVYELVDESLYM